MRRQRCPRVHCDSLASRGARFARGYTRRMGRYAEEVAVDLRYQVDTRGDRVPFAVRWAVEARGALSSRSGWSVLRCDACTPGRADGLYVC